MSQYGHLEWRVKYKPGTLRAVGYKNGKKQLTEIIHTTDIPKTIRLEANQNSIKSNRDDISVITVSVSDKDNRLVPIADNEITFTLQGPGKIIGVGNGNPTSLEPDKTVEKITEVTIRLEKEKVVDNIDNRDETANDYPDLNWQPAFKDERDQQFGKKVNALVYRGYFEMPELTGQEKVSFFFNSIGKKQSVYINGKVIAMDLVENKKGGVFILPPSLLIKGRNQIAIAAIPLLKQNSWDNLNTNPGLIQIYTPAPLNKRKLFNGLAQVIVQSTHQPGEIILKAESEGLIQSEIKIVSK